MAELSKPSVAMDFTGERFTPECVREIWYEHWHRYAFARALAAGKRVLDAACGEGYGSALLAEVAAEVTGVDISADAITHATARYGSARGLSFRQGDATALDELPSASFDLITSFETLEHLSAQDAMLAGFARLLAPGGVLLVSSPDKAEYSDKRGFDNAFHVRELYRDEFDALLSRHFRQHRLYGQKLLFQSVLWELESAGHGVAATTEADGRLCDGLAYPPLYFIAVCGQDALPALPGVHLFGDAGEAVYSHYNGEVRKNMAAGARIAELEQRIHELESRSSAPGPWWRRLFG
ncbi:MAG TPA: class I SAM-dependent methyltransferase [Rhodanobacteraceae bacterium]|nr:class I SAM-dependent methyltransferase [Rhodanobacteraceae bacterium]